MIQSHQNHYVWLVILILQWLRIVFYWILISFLIRQFHRDFHMFSHTKIHHLYCTDNYTLRLRIMYHESIVRYVLRNLFHRLRSRLVQVYWLMRCGSFFIVGFSDIYFFWWIRGRISSGICFLLCIFIHWSRDLLWGHSKNLSYAQMNIF